MSKNIAGGYSPQAHVSDGSESRGYKPLTEGFKPQGNDNMPTVIPPLPSGVQLPQTQQPSVQTPQPSVPVAVAFPQEK
jgi:hypothetical protein